MASFVGKTANQASYIGRDPTYPTDLQISTVDGIANPVQMRGSYKFDNIEVTGTFVSGLTPLSVPNMVVTDQLTLDSGLTRPTETISSSADQTIARYMFDKGTISRTGFTDATTTTDTLPTAAEFIANQTRGDYGRYQDCWIFLEYAGITNHTYVLTPGTGVTLATGMSGTFTKLGSADKRKLIWVRYTRTGLTSVECRFVELFPDARNAQVQAIEVYSPSPYILLTDSQNNANELQLSIDPPSSSGYISIPTSYKFELYTGATLNLTLTSAGQLQLPGTGGLSVTGPSTLAAVTSTGNALLRGPTFMKFTVSSVISTNNNVTYTAADVVNGFIRRDLSAAGASWTDVFPTAASLVSTYGLAVGDSFQTLMEVVTATSGGWNLNVSAGTGGTMIGFTSLGTNTKWFVQWRIIMTNVSSGTEAYYMIRHAIYQNGFTTFV